MCKSIEQGGRRCAAHTRPRYEGEVPGTPGWDDAAAAYASTREGAQRLQREATEAAARGETELEAALRNALQAGERIKAAAFEAERQIAESRAHHDLRATEDEFVRDDTWVANECIRLINESQRIVARGRDTFFDPDNPVEFGAARMAVIDLNTAAERFSDEFKADHPSLPWKALARTRSKFAHHYEDINRDLVWNMITKEMPQMVVVLQEAINRDK